MLASLQSFRRRVGAFIGGFEAGLANRRLKGFQPSRAHLNTLIAAAGPDITARARWLVRNNGYAANAIESWAGNVVGAGIKPSSLIADAALKASVQKLWLDWTDEADAEGFTDFYGLQRRAAREVFIAGEVFFRFRPRRVRDGLSVPLQLQMLPAEMLPLNRNEIMPVGNIIRQGIEFDAIGRRVAYHFLRRHPGDVTDRGVAGETVRIPASEIVHIIDPVDAGQLRGISRFAAGIVKLFLLDQYDDAELDRKKVAAMHALFITTPAPAEPLDAVEGRDENGERMPNLDKASAARLAKAHPLIRKLFAEVAKRADIVILDSQRGRAAQELAYRTRRSKARFGQSAHNWTPAIALDVCPKPIDWKNTKPFLKLAKEIVLPLAKEMQIPLRWGGDWNMNGKSEDEKFVDMPHYELTPWRSFAKDAAPFEG